MGSYVSYFFGQFNKTDKKENTLEQIKDIFKQYGSGSIDLSLVDDGIGILVINNPEKRNAMSGKMMVQLCDAISELEKWKDGRGLLIHGAGLGFCSGGDLDFIRSSTNQNLGSDMSRLLTDALNRLRALPIVSLAYIHGFGAIGGGSEIAMAADLRIISPGSKIGFVHGKMGLTPAWGGAGRLIQAVGREQALELLLSGRLVSSEVARDIGLAQKCGDLNCAESYLRSLCGFAPQIIGAMKSALVGNEGKVFVSLFGGVENKKALAAKIKHKD
ncbi:unnamed protein product [Nezara viridula]|uniref:Uncharacterized protein n=1 Tax=Nezara viridula TaxID=85310 RepID=A0A9P0HEI3_NEZVI|nr:unnamed protein product [Nezara viridula]